MQFAALPGSVLSIYGKGITNQVVGDADESVYNPDNNPSSTRDNVFFCQGNDLNTTSDGTDDFLPSTVIYHEDAKIMPTTKICPYGILELAADHTQTTLTGNVAVGSIVGPPLVFKHPNNIYTDKYRLTIVSDEPTISFFTETQEIIGSVGRYNNITVNHSSGRWPTEDQAYMFNNAHTQLTFADTDPYPAT